jgi:ABC-type enterochelin transport system permease subunit
MSKNIWTTCFMLELFFTIFWATIIVIKNKHKYYCWTHFFEDSDFHAIIIIFKICALTTLIWGLHFSSRSNRLVLLYTPNSWATVCLYMRLFGSWPQIATPKVRFATSVLASVWLSTQLRYATASKSVRHESPSQKVWQVFLPPQPTVARYFPSPTLYTSNSWATV